jgi:hypothetical protein
MAEMANVNTVLGLLLFRGCELKDVAIGWAGDAQN